MAQMQMSPMSRAKARMMLKHVFFAALVMSTEIVEDETCPTAWTDMVRIGYNPKFIASLDQDVVMFVLAHEAMHIMLKHGLRCGSRNRARWNIACDFAINLQLKKAGFTLWDHCCCDPKYEGMSAEQIYEIREQEREQRKGGGQPGKGKLGAGKKGEGVPDSGQDVDDSGMGDDVRSPDNLDPETRAEIEQSINQRVAQAAIQQRMAGKMSADLERLVNGVLNPPLPWKDLLREYMTTIVHAEENWTRRNRRISHVVLPGTYSEAMGELVLIGDSSGSVQSQEYAQIGAELNFIKAQVKPTLIRMVWADDTDCSREETWEADEEIEIHPKGGGGTDMRKPLAYVEKYNPLVCILITDGYTPWPTQEPDYPLIVCCSTNADVPIGQVVRMRP